MGIPEGDELRALDGRRFKPMVSAALSWLRKHQEAINALNVFPVPDGDTGTNMTLTMTSAWEEIADSDESHAGRLMSRIAHGALMGARGNSGVILSQIWRGFAHGLDGHRDITAEVMATAMESAAETAYKGVVKPVEGTILTVVREVAEETIVVAEETDDLVEVFERMVACAEESVARTPTLLPVLRQAGVVDSGGQGLFVILEGMLRELKGLPVADAPVARDALTELQLEAHPVSADGAVLEFDADYPYDVQFILMGGSLDVAAVRSGIEAMGDCPLTVGDEKTVKVHVHVADPGQPISFGAQFGSVSNVIVEDMQAQYLAYTATRDAKRKSSCVMPIGLFEPDEAPAISVVVVAAGDGLTNVFRSLGATAVVEGGQTMNPSTAQILDAIAGAASDEVIILPNNKNILMAAKQAAEVSEKRVRVVPTRTIPQGVSALLALDQGAALDENAESMYASSQDVITGEVTWATRDVQLNGIHVQEGDAIGLLEDALVVDARSFEEAVRWLLAEAELEDRELVTLFFGEQVTEPEAMALVAQLGTDYPDLEFEVVEGNQPHYPYIISIE